MQTTAIIMAGGTSTRMGRDKSMLLIKRQPIIKYIAGQLTSHFDQILVSSNDTSKYTFLGLQVVGDKVSGMGPLMGIASALKASRNEVNFVIACDIPEVNMGLVRRMLCESARFDAVIPKTGAKRYEPLFAVYKKSVLGMMEVALSSGKTRIMEALKHCKVKYVNLSPAEKLKNLNTMKDYQEFLKRQDNVGI